MPPGQVVDQSNARTARPARARLGLRASRSSGSLPREQKVSRMGRRLKGARQIPGRHPSGMAGGPGVHPRRPAKADTFDTRCGRLRGRCLRLQRVCRQISLPQLLLPVSLRLRIAQDQLRRRKRCQALEEIE
jgi:hypothetical protein